ncbi:MAG: threonine ammonia-lyase, biosynthetic, partial [Limnobacter sp.]|nr:threonine ammonia-lyase, biosynthetic [Limnobacter sp.]
LRFCKRLGRRSITEFNYRYADTSDAHIFVGVKLNNGHEGKERFLKEFAQAGYSILDISDNEMAKLHLRYMVGGRSQPQGNGRALRI